MKNDPTGKSAAGTKYVAFLRGINVGGNKIVKMEDLRAAFEALKFRNVKTLLASGNVLFETSKAEGTELGIKIAEKLKSAFGLEAGVIIRPIEELQRLADMKPFEKVKVTPETRLYVTFLCEKRVGGLKIPYRSAEGDLNILCASDRAVCSAIVLAPGRGTIELMAFLEKEFGKRLTTRNWNTIVKILKG